MVKIRWFMLALGVGILLPAILRGETREASFSFLIGMPYGVLLDLVLGRLIGFWKYGGSKKEYIFITVPCWGIFGMAVNLIWDWIGVPWISFLVVTIGLFAYLELPNLKTKSWTYYSPKWLVIAGWIPLTLSFRLLYLLFAH